MKKFLPGDILKSKRERLGFSQREVAKRASIPHMTYRRIEDNESLSKSVVLERIARVLGIGHVADLFPPLPMMRAFILVQLEDSEQIRTKEVLNEIAAYACDLPGLKVFYTLWGNKLLADIWANGPKQVSMFRDTFLNEYVEFVVSTQTMIVLDEHTPRVGEIDLHPATRLKFELKERVAQSAKACAWVEIDVGYKQHQEVALAISGLPQSLEVYTVSGATDILCRMYSDSRSGVERFCELIGDLRGVSSVKEYTIAKTLSATNLLRTIRSCGELVGDVLGELEQNPESVLRLSEFDLEGISEYLQNVGEDMVKIKGFIESHRRENSDFRKGKTQ